MTDTQQTEDGHRGMPASELNEPDLIRELRHLHETRHATFLHGTEDALANHTQRLIELEAEYLRRHPERSVDPGRTREGTRTRQQ
jgi:hypothetical protein